MLRRLPKVVWHSGGLPGFLSHVMFLPWDSFGVVALINYAETASPGEVALRAIDSVLGFTTADSSESADRAFKVDPLLENRVQRPEEGATVIDNVNGLPLPLHAYEGTYHHPAYDSFTICSYVSSSHYCNRLVSDFKATNRNVGSFDLFAAWPRLWVSHAYFKPHFGNQFDVLPATLFPHGYGKNTTPFTAWWSQTLAAEFVVQNYTVLGLAVTDNFEALRSGEGELRDVADVYFEKVH